VDREVMTWLGCDIGESGGRMMYCLSPREVFVLGGLGRVGCCCCWGCG